MNLTIDQMTILAFGLTIASWALVKGIGKLFKID